MMNHVQAEYSDFDHYKKFVGGSQKPAISQSVSDLRSLSRHTTSGGECDPYYVSERAVGPERLYKLPKPINLMGTEVTHSIDRLFIKDKPSESRN